MHSLVLEHKDMQATFDLTGLRLTSLRKGKIEAIAHAAPAGIIGPRFGARRSALTGNTPERFVHGVGRFADWKVSRTDQSFVATCTGEDMLDGKALKDIEKQPFRMEVRGDLTEKGLSLAFSIVSDTDSCLGLETQFMLATGRGSVEGRTHHQYAQEQVRKDLPVGWIDPDSYKLYFDLTQEANCVFNPPAGQTGNALRLETPEYKLAIVMETDSSESCWQLKKKAGSHEVSLSLMTAENPYKPQLTASAMRTHFSFV